MGQPDPDSRVNAILHRLEGLDEAAVVRLAAIAHPAKPGIAGPDDGTGGRGGFGRDQVGGFAEVLQTVVAVAANVGLPFAESAGQEAVVPRIDGAAEGGVLEVLTQEGAHDLGQALARARPIPTAGLVGLAGTVDGEVCLRAVTVVLAPEVEGRLYSHAEAGRAIHQPKVAALQAEGVWGQDGDAHFVQLAQAGVESGKGRDVHGIDAQHPVIGTVLGHPEEGDGLLDRPGPGTQDYLAGVLTVCQRRGVEQDVHLAGPLGRGRRHLELAADRFSCCGNGIPTLDLDQDLGRSASDSFVQRELQAIGRAAVNHVGRRQLDLQGSGRIGLCRDSRSKCEGEKHQRTAAPVTPSSVGCRFLAVGAVHGGPP